MKNRELRTFALIGEEGIQKLNKAKVTVVGVGGVGGQAVEILARAHISNFVLIDFDKFDETNLNRQLGSLYSNLGEYKVNVFKKRILDINPDANVQLYTEKINEENYEKLLQDSEYILDLCDDINAKKLIIDYAYYNKKSIISSMGAGNRIDISNIKINTLDRTSYCPLAKKLRQSIDKNIQKKTKVCYYESESSKTNSSVIGTISYAPANMGLFIAYNLIKGILK